MARFRLHVPLGALMLAGTAMLMCGQAQAQGTDEQREACAPDAVRLCQDTIPDIPKTTACMKAHFAQLSPRCKVAFNAVTGGASAGPSAPRHEGMAPVVPPEPDGAEDGVAAAPAPAPEGIPGLHGYEAQIRKYCHEGLIDPFTCRNTLAALRGIE